ncbi:MAG: hypothetical protein V6Z86_05060 [Hyphomicrobiales bacterium]
MIVPRPVGPHMAGVETSRDDDLLHSLERGRGAVIDPGFFSVDWGGLEDGEIRCCSRSTRLKAMSVVLEETARAITRDHGSVARPAGRRKARDLSVPTGHFDRQFRLFGGQARFCSHEDGRDVLIPVEVKARDRQRRYRADVVPLITPVGADWRGMPEVSDRACVCVSKRQSRGFGQVYRSDAEGTPGDRPSVGSLPGLDEAGCKTRRRQDCVWVWRRVQEKRGKRGGDYRKAPSWTRHFLLIPTMGKGG